MTRLRAATAEHATILDRARAGSGPAFEAMYADLAPAVASYLRHSGVEDPDGLTNEVLAQVHRRLPRFTGDWTALRSWVFTIAHHRMVDARRRASRRPVAVAPVDAHDQPAGDSESEAMASLSDDQVRALLAELAPDQQEVLLLRIVADLPLEGVASAMGRSVGAVKSLQHRALASLRRALESEDLHNDA